MLTVYTELGINPPPCTDQMVVNILVTFIWFRLAPPQTALFAMKRLGPGKPQKQYGRRSSSVFSNISTLFRV
jgi:hypothetical protein